MESLTQLISNLGIDSDRSETLGLLKPALSACSKEQLRSNLGTLNLVPLFDCLNTENKDEITTTCDVLKKLLSYVDSTIVLERYLSVMEKGLPHPNPSVGCLVISQLQRCSHDEDLVKPLVNSSIFPMVIDSIGREMEVSKETVSLFLWLAETPEGMKALTSNQTTNRFQQLSAKDETIRFRVLDLMVRLTQLSEEHLVAVEATGFLQQIVNQVHIDDILVQLNAIELLIHLAMTHQGMKYLSNQGVIRSLESILESVANNPMAELLVPGIVKFFGNIAHLRPKQVLLEYPSFVSALFSMAESSDDSQKAMAFDTIGYVGISLEGKMSLAEVGNKMTHCIEKLGGLINDAPTEIRIRGMNAFASLIKLDKENQSPEYLSITESWYQLVTGSGRGLNMLVNIARQPFQDLRLGAFELLLIVASQDWGRKRICRHPGLVEFLLDRGTEGEKLGKESKYRIIAALANSEDIINVIGQDAMAQLKQYVKEGPFYVRVQAEVATEGAE